MSAWRSRRERRRSGMMQPWIRQRRRSAAGPVDRALAGRAPSLPPEAAEAAGRARAAARTLARLLWAGELDAGWMPDERCRVLRRRLARREQLVRSRSRAKDEIHAVLMRRLRGRSPVSDLFGVKGREWLSE